MSTGNLGAAPLTSKKILIKNIASIISETLTRKRTVRLQYDWQNNARPAQLIPPGDWRVWLIMAGRGYGKTRTGAETIRQWVMHEGYKRIALLADTESEGRDIMIEGPSGLLAVHAPYERPIYESSKRRLTWPNGAVGTLFSAENTEQLRGPQFDAAWVDELAKFRCDQTAWDQLNFGLRLGHNPRIIVTTTPRPTQLIKQLVKEEGTETFVTRGTTFENSENLAKNYLKQLRKRYEGTALGAQEIYGSILENIAGALWSYADISQAQIDEVPNLERVIVAIDPAVTASSTSDETGIIVAGVDHDNKAYILQDKSIKAKPYDWAKLAIKTYHEYKADCIVAEINQGGDLVATMLRSIDDSIPFKGVHATRGKALRAEPVAALYQQQRVFHKRSLNLEKLEAQMCSYIPGHTKKSPDRLDALVWAITELMLKPNQSMNSGLWT